MKVTHHRQQQETDILAKRYATPATAAELMMHVIHVEVLTHIRQHL